MLFSIIIMIEYISKSYQIAPEFVNFLTIRRSKANNYTILYVFRRHFIRRRNLFATQQTHRLES